MTLDDFLDLALQTNKLMNKRTNNANSRVASQLKRKKGQSPLMFTKMTYSCDLYKMARRIQIQQEIVTDS